MAPTGRRKPPAAKTRTTSAAVTTTTTTTTITSADLQPLLNIFATAFREWLDPNTFHEKLQQVKGHLYRREFAAAFGSAEYLQVYASRWSAARALAYADVFARVFPHLVVQDSHHDVLSLGGGAGAELVAFAALAASTKTSVNVTCVDNADWSPVLGFLDAQSKSSLSKGQPLAFTSDFKCLDLLSGEGTDNDELTTLFEQSSFITIMFTLNELYSTSLASTQSLLLRLTAAAAIGTLLLVVDSPGSYSTVVLAGKEKKYPMAWLLDHTLLKVAAEVHGSEGGGVEDEQVSRWEKILTDESQWFRLPIGLKYPIELENMRYQIHLYRRK